MTIKQFQTTRALIAVFIGFVVAIASANNNLYLAISGVLIGVLFLFLVRSKFKQIIVDERVSSISGKAGRIAYTISTAVFAFLGLLLIISGRSRGDFFTENVGTILSYSAMLNIAIYSISFYYFNKKYGGE